MKISKIKIEKRRLMKWLLYIVAAYLLASWGVNGILNPLHYFRSWNMQKVPLVFEEDNGRYCAALPENIQDYAYLSFAVADSIDYFFDLVLCGQNAAGEQEQKIQRVHRGWNSVDFAQVQWRTVEISQDTIDAQGLCLEHVFLTQYRRPDFGRMIYVSASLMFFSVFWECIWWIKRKYAQ